MAVQARVNVGGTLVPHTGRLNLGGVLRAFTAPAVPAAPPVLYSEAWSGADAAAWPAQWALGKQPSAGGAASIVGGQGRLMTGTAGGFSAADTISRRLPDVQPDAEILVKVTSRDVGGFAHLVFRHSTSSVDASFANSFYALNMNASTGFQWLRRPVGGGSQVNMGARVPFTMPTGVASWVRARVVGDVLQARMWRDGDPEPTVWPAGADLVDGAITAAGYLGLLLTGGSAASRSVDFDDLTVTTGKASAPVAPPTPPAPVAATWREAKDSFDFDSMAAWMLTQTGPRVAVSGTAPGGTVTTQAQCDAMAGRTVTENVVFNPAAGVTLLPVDVLFLGKVEGSFNRSVTMRFCTIDGNDQTAVAEHFYPRGTWRLENSRIRKAQDGIKVPSGSSFTGRDCLVHEPSQLVGALTGSATHQDGAQVVGGTMDLERVVIDYPDNHDQGQGIIVKADAGAIGAIRVVDSAVRSGGNMLTFEPHATNAGPTSIDLGAGVLRNVFAPTPRMINVLSLFEPNGQMATGPRAQLLGSSFFAAGTGRVISYANGISRAVLEAPRFPVGVLQADTNARLDEVVAAGASLSYVGVSWSAVQASAGAALDLTEVNARIDYAIGRGLKVVLRPGAQYPPSWARTAVPLYKDQNGAEWTSTNPGEQVRDWVWNAIGKQYIEDFYTKLVQGIGATRRAALYSVQTGLGFYGETQLPRVNLTAELKWWGGGAAAQTGTGLAADQVVCPAPGHKPFDGVPTGTAGSATDLAFVEWYRSSVRVRMLSLVAALRAGGWTGPVQVLHPSFGVRDNWTSATFGWREQHAQGVDWEHQIAGYASDTYPWCTDVGKVDPWHTPTVDSDRSAGYKIADLATRYGRTAYLGGENTGGGSIADQDRFFTDLDRYGYRAALYAFYSTLVDGTGDSLSNFTANVDRLS